MPKALAVVAHHDDHVLWMGGTTMRLATLGWQWTVVAMCVPDPARQQYFLHCCSIFGAIPIYFEFLDYMGGEPFSQNNRDAMTRNLAEATNGETFDLVFTHSRSPSGEYWARHANHVEAREVATGLIDQNQLGSGRRKLAHFAYDVIYGGGTATCAARDAQFVLPLTYSELLWKCQLSSLAPDANTSLRNIGFPCPNPEAFEGDDLQLPEPIRKRQVPST